ncbi:MAG: hypothetical protein AAFX04_06430 [Pseudomonadota bacterium]
MSRQIALPVVAALLALPPLTGCSEADAPVDETGEALSEEEKMERQADSLEEAADKAMAIEIESLGGDAPEPATRSGE